MKQRGKKNERNEDNLRDFWDNVKSPNIRIMGVPEEEDKKKGHEKILEEIIVENFPKMGKEIVTQVRETQSPKQDKSKMKHSFPTRRSSDLSALLGLGWLFPSPF